MLNLECSLFGVKTWTLQKVYQKYLESFEMRCCRKMEKISWTDHVKNEVLQRDKEYPTKNKKEGRLTGMVTSCVGTAF